MTVESSVWRLIIRRIIVPALPTGIFALFVAFVFDAPILGGAIFFLLTALSIGIVSLVHLGLGVRSVRTACGRIHLSRVLRGVITIRRSDVQEVAAFRAYTGFDLFRVHTGDRSLWLSADGMSRRQIAKLKSMLWSRTSLEGQGFESRAWRTLVIASALFLGGCGAIIALSGDWLLGVPITLIFCSVALLNACRCRGR